MNRVSSTISGHPLLCYFVLAYGITWTGIFLIVGFDGLLSGELDLSRGLLVWGLMLCGPGVSGLLLTWMFDGRAGLRTFRERMLRWRLPIRWYAALLVAPVTCALVAGVLWSYSSDFAPMFFAEPDKTFVVIIFFVLVFGAFVEELGWTGFATPRMRLIYGLTGTSLLLGFLHGVWHFMADFSGRGDTNAVLYSANFIIFWIGALVVLRMLIVWAYQHTESLLLGQLIHAFYTAPLFLLTPAGASPAQLLLMWTAFSFLFAVITLVITSGRTAVLTDTDSVRSLFNTVARGFRSRPS
jgi:uncharacterized protein